MYFTLIQAVISLYAAAVLASLASFRTKKKDFARKTSVALALLGALVHLGALVSVGLEKGHFPVTTPNEAFSSFVFLAVALYIALHLIYRVPWLSTLILPAAILILAVAPFLPEVSRAYEPRPLGAMFFVHTALALLASTLLFGHLVMSIFYIVQRIKIKTKSVSFLGSAIPSLEACDRLSVKMLWSGFVCLTFAILTGAIWAAQSRGHFFAWKAPEYFALLSWFLFGAVLELRSHYGWRGLRSSVWSLVAFAVLIAVFATVVLT